MKRDRRRLRATNARPPATTLLRIEVLENRSMLTVPALPVIIEPLNNGQVVSRFDIHMEVDPNAFSDADGDTHKATNWQIRETTANGGAVVWQALNVTDALSKVHIHQGDGTFVGTLAGQTALTRDHAYTLNVSFVDSRSETSGTSVRSFVTANDIDSVPGAGTWIPHEGYKVELAATAGAFRLPVNIAFVPNPGSAPNSPFYYVSELYGSIQMVTRDGQVSTYATGLLDYNPSGPISGAGEQGLTGLTVDPTTGDLFVGMLWNNGTTATQRGGATLHYPKVERLHSTDGGRTMASRTILLNMQPETQGQSHQISNISIGPDNKLYVHMGDAFDSSTALDLNQYRGKVLRMNLDGTAASDSPFYNAADGINAKDYVYTYGHRNPFGGAWRALDGVHYVVEDGNAVDRLVAVASGQSYGWAGDDSALVNNSNYIWQPANAVVNIAMVQPQTFGGSLYPAGSQNDAFVALSGPTYSSGPQETGKRIAWFPDLDSRGAGGKLTAQPITLVQYNGTGRATVVGLAAGPDGVYFTDLYRDDGVGGATAVGANVYRVRYVDFHPTDLAATAGNAQVTLNWSTDPLAVSYNVYRSTGTGAPVLVGANVIGGAFSDATVTNGTHYHYIVRGVNAGGESDDSNEAGATPSGAAAQPPTVAVAASASPSPVIGTTTNLSVLGADDGGEANLVYTWALQGTPPAAVGFSENGTNAAKNTVVTFIAAGAYTFDVTIRDGANQTVHSLVTVTVNQTLTSVTVSPGAASVATGGMQQFTASALDQFTRPLTAQPTFTWSIASGVGTINTSGLYQAPAAAGSATVRATTGAKSATAAVTVSAAAARQGLTAIYYNNADLTGTSFLRNDATVNFDFVLGSPSTFIASDTFSARWIGFIVPLYTQTYTFITTSDDGVRLWVNNQQIINQWNDHGVTQHTGTIALVAGTRYDIRLEFYDNTEEAVIKLEWQSTSQARQIVPQSQLFSTLPITINFQPSGAAVPIGYLVDAGSAFGDRGNGYSYGWNGNNVSTAIDRNSTNSPDQRYDTFMQMQQAALPNAAWEIAIPNGLYRVHIVSGDPTSNASVYKVNVEGVLAVNGTPTNSNRWIEGWVDVTVSDGRLSITNATGSTNNKINYVDIIPLSVVAANPAPTVAVAASASPSPVVGTTTNLSVLGADDGGEASLLYTWALQGTPPAAVAFSANGTNAAKNTVATFSKAGSYTFDVTIRDGANQTVHSLVTVTVNQTLTSVTVSPTTAAVAINGTRQFTATALDQFNQPLTSQPAFTWNIASGVGSISATGLYQAPGAAGSATVRATTGALSATAAVTVSAGGLNFGAGFTGATGLTLNGSTAFVGPILKLTNGGQGQVASVFSTARIAASRFQTQFDFQLNNPNADGFTFCVQGSAATAIGDGGGGLGYGVDPDGGTAKIAKSIAVKFDLYDNQGEGANATGLFTNGAAPGLGSVTPTSGSTNLTTAGIDLHSQHVFRTNISYDGVQLTVAIKDLTTNVTATQVYQINLTTFLGASDAFVGFTAGTGGLSATMAILNWTYTPL